MPHNPCVNLTLSTLQLVTVGFQCGRVACVVRDLRLVHFINVALGWFRVLRLLCRTLRRRASIARTIGEYVLLEDPHLAGLFPCDRRFRHRSKKFEVPNEAREGSIRCDRGCFHRFASDDHRLGSRAVSYSKNPVLTEEERRGLRDPPQQRFPFQRAFRLLSSAAMDF